MGSRRWPRSPSCRCRGCSPPTHPRCPPTHPPQLPVVQPYTSLGGRPSQPYTSLGGRPSQPYTSLGDGRRATLHARSEGRYSRPTYNAMIQGRPGTLHTRTPSINPTIAIIQPCTRHHEPYTRQPATLHTRTRHAHARTHARTHTAGIAAK